MDWFKIKKRQAKGVLEVYPDFKVGRSKDLMVRGGNFYAIWDTTTGLWSQDEYDVARLVDAELYSYVKKEKGKNGQQIRAKTMSDFSSNTWGQFQAYMSKIADNATQLDSRLVFLNTKVVKKDHVSKRLPYPLEGGECAAYEELMGTLYSEKELQKIEWSIGSIVDGASVDIQKFMVFFGDAGSGKSTALNLIQKLFPGYYAMFDAKALTSTNNSFSTEAFRNNPLVGIQHDANLSRVQDNSTLNSLVSHEEIVINEKFKASYSARPNCLLFIATNTPVRITDSKSGLIRRLIDIRPSGDRVSEDRYDILISRMEFELGAIAQRCLDVFQNMGKDYYARYRPLDMMMRTDVFFNFVEEFMFGYKQDNMVTLKRAWTTYKQFCEDSNIEHVLPRHKFRDEMKEYWHEFHPVLRVENKQLRSVYKGFKSEKFEITPPSKIEPKVSSWLDFDAKISIFDAVCAKQPAQYASRSQTPTTKWSDNTDVLSDLDTNKLHYVQVPVNHVIIDFDVRDQEGKKSRRLSIEAASKWPKTYAEYSKGQGIHLHYIYDGEASKLSAVYDLNIEVKVAVGDASIRRRLSRSNGEPIAHINAGLPLKGVKVTSGDTMQSERALRLLLKRNLDREFHESTKPSMDFMAKILADAYESDMSYDITDMKATILSFAMSSTNQSSYCVKLISTMPFKSKSQSEGGIDYKDAKIAFYDIEVLPNLFLVCWKYPGKDQPVTRMYNPEPDEMEGLMNMRLVGFNNRRYDNHIIYARYLGKSVHELYEISSKIVNNDRKVLYAEAYGLSYADVYDYAVKKQSLKKWELELGLVHIEMDHAWDEPLPKKLWEKAGTYCDNDVVATEAVFNHTAADFNARKILAALSGLTPNDSTLRHTSAIIFGRNRTPQDKFIYTDLSEDFPGYKFDAGKSTYHGIDVGEGGYVYSEPGIYRDVIYLDVESMHPASIEALNLFGDTYTKKYSELKAARVAIKNGQLDEAKTMFNGQLAPYITSKADADDLADALKLVINSVYGFTFARFDNPFRDIRNVDNIVAKRGALFMLDLQLAVQEKGYTVAHCKTDSIKIVGPDKDIIDFVYDFGQKYGYKFGVDGHFSQMCLVNKAVLIGKWDSVKDTKHNGEWSATGAQFRHPYVFKKLFSGEAIGMQDLSELKTVKTFLHLDINEGLAEGKHNRRFVGKVGSFSPILPGHGGGLLVREKDGDFHAATGTKGYRWLESEIVKELGLMEHIDLKYFDGLVEAAVAEISKHGDFYDFIKN